MEEILQLKEELRTIKNLLEELCSNTKKKINEIEDKYQYFDAKQVMKCYNINKDTLIKYRNSGVIKFKKLGTGNYLYPKSQFLFKEGK